jgi:hypothetical protein
MPKYNARVDRNQAEIVEAFRRYGASVAHTHTLGQGFPDLVVGYRGQNWLVEVKDWMKPPSQRKLTAAEQEFRDAWRGSYHVVETVGDVAAMLEAYHKLEEAA